MIQILCETSWRTIVENAIFGRELVTKGVTIKTKRALILNSLSSALLINTAIEMNRQAILSKLAIFELVIT